MEKAEAELSQIKSEITERESQSLNQSLTSSVLESREIGERYEQIKTEFFREKNRNREIIEGLQERLDDMQRQYEVRSVTRQKCVKNQSPSQVVSE